MTDRVLDLSERPASLSVRNSLLSIRFDQEEPITVPLSDLAVVIVSHPQVSYTHAVLSGLAMAGASFVTCDEKHLPVSMLLPLVAHSLQTERFAAQASLPLPVRKRLWQQIARSNILAQARLLKQRTGSDGGLGGFALQVRSGDPANLEARAARVYWQKVFGEIEFRRDGEQDGLNACLNYGYAVLRAIVARSICGAGLHPSLTVHHHNRYDAFCLADDLMEPFRPVVDSVVAGLRDERGADVPLDRDAKKRILETLLARFDWNDESRTLFDWLGRVADSLAAAIQAGEAGAAKLFIPEL
jgi:CRISPR-associated protein Cas1